MGVETRAILIVDDDVDFRRLMTAQIVRSGREVFTAADYRTGLELVQAQPTIGIAILDHPTQDSQLDSIVSALHELRPELRIIGNSGADRRAEFCSAGVQMYLQKPWRLGDLEGMLAGRLCTCAECGSPLPLRLPREDETGDCWICVGCGNRFRALLDENASPDLRAYVVRAN